MSIGATISSFAISIAANIVSSLFARTDTEKEIRAAFQEAIEEWCPNEDIRKHRESEITRVIQSYVENPAIDPADLPEDECEFISIFMKKVSNHPAAYSYLSAITGREYYNVVMQSLHAANLKLDDISRKLDSVNPQHDELHAEAVIEINTVLHETIEEQINILLRGIFAAFDDEIFAYIDTVNENVSVVIDEGSYLMHEDGEFYRPKYHDIEYDWDKETFFGWSNIEPDFDFYELFSAAYIAAFQLVSLDFREAEKCLLECIDKNNVNDQLSVNEKRHLSYIIQQLRAVQSVFDDHHDIFLHIKECSFANLHVHCEKQLEKDGDRIGIFDIIYDDNRYSEEITQIVAPVQMESHLLDVYEINPEYYYKLTGYVGDLFSLVTEWWELSGGGFLQEKMAGETDLS